MHLMLSGGILPERFRQAPHGEFDPIGDLRKRVAQVEVIVKGSRHGL